MTEAGTLEPITGTGIRLVWPLIRARLAALAIEQAEPWMPEDVFHEIMLGTSYLWVTENAEGFVVLQIQATPYERDLHCWIACNDTMARAGEYMAQLVEIARDHGCQRVTFDSKRKGWEREVPGVEVSYCYSVKVGD